VASCDPNEIQGPAGYGPSKFVSVGETLPYTILFENDPEFATVPAQRVTITKKVTDKFDIGSFRISDFGFGPYTFSVPPGLSQYTSRIDLPDSVGIDVNITTGIDIVNRELFWILQTIDPATGLPPDDAFKGFLPVNDTTGIGEGFVNFTIKPRSTDKTGDSLIAKASIVFDINAPIETNTAVNIVDAYPPASVVLPNVTVEHNSIITMNVDIDDDAGGSGVQYFDMYVSENGGPFVKFDSLLTNPVVSFTGEPGNTYCFFSRGTDNVLNVENLKNICELTVTLTDPSLPVTWLNFSGQQQQNDVKLTWATSSEINVSHFILERSTNGTVFENVARVDARGAANITTGYAYVDVNAAKMAVPNLYYRLRKLDKDGTVGYSGTINVPLERVFSGVIINAYPNPFIKEIRTEVISGNPTDVIRSIELVNVSGKVVYTRQVNQAVNRTVTLEIPEQLSKGVYILKVRVNDEIRTLKVTRL
jgi:Secretion system C-terminal sorting domain